jgi:hypothetical protein
LSTAAIAVVPGDLIFKRSTMGSASVNLALRLSTGNGESFNRAEIDITPNHSGPIVKDRFQVKPAIARPVINIDKH